MIMQINSISSKTHGMEKLQRKVTRLSTVTNVSSQDIFRLDVE